jgi:hypothetical protein
MSASPVNDEFSGYREQTVAAFARSMFIQLYRGEFIREQARSHWGMHSKGGSEPAREDGLKNTTPPRARNKNAKRNAWHFV